MDIQTIAILVFGFFAVLAVVGVAFAFSLFLISNLPGDKEAGE